MKYGNGNTILDEGAGEWYSLLVEVIEVKNY